MWGKKQFLEDLKKYRSAKDVCRIHAEDLASISESTLTWRGLYNDVWRWRKVDKAFDAEVRRLIVPRTGGRPPKDGGDHSWEDKFCEEFYRTSGNLGAAADVTPYSISQIMEFLNENSTSYRKEFAEKFSEVKFRIVGELQSLFLEQRKLDSYSTLEQANIAAKKAWVSLKGLEKLHPALWGKKSELNVQGSIKHLHGAQRLLPPEERLAQLWDEQKQFFERRREEALQLADGRHNTVTAQLPQQEEIILEAEVVNAATEV